jgi:adenine deaminase
LSARIVLGTLVLREPKRRVMSSSKSSAPHSFSEEILTRQRLVRVALGQEAADLVLRGATVLNVHTNSWKTGWDIVISGERIAWVGPSGKWPGQALQTVSAEKSWAVPGFGEPHKHIESTMLSPEYEADLVLRFGTTWTVEASHEFSNVNGERNVEFWMTARKQGSPFKIFPSLGSATPPTGWEESGGHYAYDEIARFMAQNLWVTGLDEVMDWAAVLNPKNPGYQRIWENIQATIESRGVVEGHASGLSDIENICAFSAAGISSDHELSFGEEAWNKLERGLFLEIRPHSIAVLKYLVEQGLTDWSNISVTTDDRNAETTLRQGAMDFNIRTAIDSGVPMEAAYALGSYNVARHFRIDHWVGSLTPGRYADIVLLSDPAKVVIDQVYSDGKKVSEKGRPLLPVPKIEWPDWATKTVNLGGVIEASHFIVAAPPDRGAVQAAILKPFHFEPDFMTAVLPVRKGIVQRDEANGITKVALLDRYSGQIRVSRMFWRGVGTSTPNSAMACSIVHDNHNSWVTGSSDEAMALAVNTMAEIDGGYVLVREGKVVSTLRLEIGGLMTARSAEAFSDNLKQMRAEMDQMEWLDEERHWIQDFLGVNHMTEVLIYGFLTCPPWHWTFIPPTPLVPEGLINIRTGQIHPVVW